MITITIFIQMGCKKNETCSSEEHVFDISEDTKKWLPNEVLTKELKFESENGEIMIFQKDTVYHREFSNELFITCGDGQKSETIFFERIAHIYSSGDTADISLSTNIVNNGCTLDVVDKLELIEEVVARVEKWRFNPTKAKDIGYLSIRTKSINTDESDNICWEHYAKFNSEIELNGINYQEVYTDDRPKHENAEFPLAEIYFKKGEGLIGFADENGKKWRRIE
ncbi:MAG: hypothetical protein IPN76_32970 [Saprospiraceae bacterium]|nr:hypothetical protein [Saprospiraceae bacterium]